MDVQSIMTTNVITIGEKELVYDASIKMMKNDIGCLVVVRDEKPVGVVTETDIIERVIVERKDASGCEVRDIMTTPPVSIQSLASVKEAVDVMNDKGVKRLVVVAENTGTLAGIITSKDLVLAEGKMIGVLQNYVKYLKDTCNIDEGKKTKKSK